MKNKLLILTILTVLLLSGCPQSSDPANGNRTANGNSAVSNAAVSSNANNSTPAVNANTNAANSNASKPEQTADTNVAAKQNDPADKEKSDCTVIEDNADFFVSATEKTVKLKKGTLVNVVSWEMHQGLYAVNAEIGGKWTRGEINYELINCPDDGKNEPGKK